MSIIVKRIEKDKIGWKVPIKTTVNIGLNQKVYINYRYFDTLESAKLFLKSERRQ